MSDPVELDSLQRSPLSNEVLDTLGVRTGVLDTAADQAARDDPGVRALLSDVMQSGPATAEDQADLAAGISAAPDSEKARSVGLRGLTPPAAAPDGSPLLRDKDIANLILQATTPSGGGGARRVTTDTLEQTLPARVPPELRSQIDKRRERLETAQEEVTRKAQQIAETAAAVHRGQAKIIDDVRAEAAERNAALEERHAELREDIEEAGVKYNALKEEAARETDPGRLWNNMSTGSKILASIASALGGVNAAITGGENMVMRQLQTAIDRDIQAQESNRRAAERRAGDILNYQQALRGIMGDD
nr:hypothetical protein [Anaerolineae bacterium]